MLEISYGTMFVIISVIWLLNRFWVALKSKSIDWKREAQLLLVYICIVVIVRFTFCPFGKVDGKIQPLLFSVEKMWPFRINLLPFVHMADYEVFKEAILNFVGNTLMFVPVGIVYPIVYKKLDTTQKIILAGSGFSLAIEILQLPFYDRVSDIDDLILNSLGYTLGYLIYLGTKRKNYKRMNVSDMKYSELPLPWQRIFSLEWESICNGSKAIAAVIVNEEGEIVSEGRNQISECRVPNPATAHAETEAIRNLDIRKYPHPQSYTLYAGLEPCIMCMGTIVMGHIRKVIIAARDDFGGAMHLIDHSKFVRSKGIQVTFLDNELGDMQRAFQALRELMYNDDNEKLAAMLEDFSVYNKVGVDAAIQLMKDGFFKERTLGEIAAEEVFDALMSKFRK